MKTIWKFELPLLDSPAVTMPKGAIPISVQAQSGMFDLSVWAEVEVGFPQEVELHRFNIVGTGNPIERDLGKFLGTVQLNGGTRVFHVYDGGVL